MSMGELFITFTVAVLAFGPKQLPLLAKHLSQAKAAMEQLRHHILQFWQAQINTLKFHENMQKAEDADQQYPQCPRSESE